MVVFQTVPSFRLMGQGHYAKIIAARETPKNVMKALSPNLLAPSVNTAMADATGVLD
jgi:hypothetical protein